MDYFHERFFISEYEFVLLTILKIIAKTDIPFTLQGIFDGALCWSLTVLVLCFHLRYGPQREKICLLSLQKNQRRRPDCTFAQTDQRLSYLLI